MDAVPAGGRCSARKEVRRSAIALGQLRLALVGAVVPLAYFSAVMTHWGLLDMTSNGASSRISFEFLSTQRLDLAKLLAEQ